MVYIQYHQTVPKRVQVGQDTYVAVVRANIAMLQVKEEHVDAVLAIKGGCCGNKKSGVFFIPPEDHIRRWENGGGR